MEDLKAKIFSVSDSSYDQAKLGEENPEINCCDTSKFRDDLLEYINTECAAKNAGYIINPYYKYF